MESFPYRRLTLSVGYKSFPYILMRGGQAKVSLEPSAYLIPFSHIGVSFLMVSSPWVCFANSLSHPYQISAPQLQGLQLFPITYPVNLSCRLYSMSKANELNLECLVWYNFTYQSLISNSKLTDGQFNTTNMFPSLTRRIENIISTFLLLHK